MNMLRRFVAAVTGTVIPDETGVCENFAWAVYTVDSALSPADTAMIDPVAGVARWNDRVVLVNRDGSPVTGLTRRQVFDKYTASTASVYTLPGLYTVYTSSRDGKILDWAQVLTLILGGFEFAHRSRGRFEKDERVQVFPNDLMLAHDAAHLKDVFFSPTVTPLASWLSFLVLDAHPFLSLELIVSAVSSRVDAVLDPSFDPEANPDWRLNAWGTLMSFLVAPVVSGRTPVVPPKRYITDTLWWYLYRCAYLYKEARTDVTGSITWVRVEPGVAVCESGGCLPLSTLRVGGLFDPVTGEGGDSAGFEFFVGVNTDGSRFDHTPVDVAGAGSDVSGLLAALLRYRFERLQSAVAADLEVVLRDRLDLPSLWVIPGAVVFVPLVAGFFDVLTSVLADRVGGPGVFWGMADWAVRVPGVSTVSEVEPSDDLMFDDDMCLPVASLLGPGRLLLALGLVDDRDGLPPSMAEQEALLVWGVPDLYAEAKRVGLDWEVEYARCGVGSLDSHMLVFLVRDRYHAGVRALLVDYYSDPSLRSSVSPDWYLRLNGVSTVPVDRTDD